MLVEPKVRGFICTTAHPVGCAAQVQRQIDYVKQQPTLSGPKKVLVIGASTGYGLASRITASFGCGAQTIGVFFEKEAAGKRTASPGWYNSAAFEKEAHKAGLYAKSINGDAFSNDIKEQTIELIKKDWQGDVDLVVYSLASPRRIDPVTGEDYRSVLKTVGQPFTDKTVDVLAGTVGEVTIDPANADEIANTEKVMGGEDWQLWMDALLEAGVLAKGVKTVAYSYVGPELTFPIYREGTIGLAKKHLEATVTNLNEKLTGLSGSAYISVNKCLVTQAAAAIPVVPLYASLLYKVMKDKNLHEGCIEQIVRLFSERLYEDKVPCDKEGLIRIDDWEMKPEVQAEVEALWKQVSTENLMDISDLAGYRQEFYQLFGFETKGVDYSQDVDVNVAVPSLK
ncbi:enoyl-ACP reductase FabV [Piscirickettsia litoralis]|uniref:Enoyl-[acyl-carrier-protein] reductase [NADH] n=1 Tax=Piscirickettsia litoralis TaxID=1891921 RepID=A0ABX3A0M1_9GAMM|nr:enoyl-ACP reductase FabV [Piscirickettsia litoralis]ODN42174.1 trans-2-enoyl-CoA reductase [Piscirickettsia litoralis]